VFASDVRAFFGRALQEQLTLNGIPSNGDLARWIEEAEAQEGCRGCDGPSRSGVVVAHG
jgi:hypothetical protein